MAARHLLSTRCLSGLAESLQSSIFHDTERVTLFLCPWVSPCQTYAPTSPALQQLEVSLLASARAYLEASARCDEVGRACQLLARSAMLKQKCFRPRDVYFLPGLALQD